jgi:hypothetical protein
MVIALIVDGCSAEALATCWLGKARRTAVAWAKHVGSSNVRSVGCTSFADCAFATNDERIFIKPSSLSDVL